MSASAKNFFTKIQQAEILLAIKSAELDTSGEIRVHIESHYHGDVLDRAAQVFDKLKMQNTKLRNGVLFYLSIDNRKFAVIGDAGVNAVVKDDFWNNVMTIMTEYFIEGNFTEGLIEGIKQVGEELKKFFPYQDDDVNELPDEISFGEN
ncbi:MAG: TPM domain-containing protein [Bacteroidales bacterium]